MTTNCTHYVTFERESEGEKRRERAGFMAMHKFRRRIKKAVPRAKHVYNVPEAGIGVRDEISRRAFFPSKYHSHRRSLTRSLVSGARSDVTRHVHGR